MGKGVRNFAIKFEKGEIILLLVVMCVKRAHKKGSYLVYNAWQNCQKTQGLIIIWVYLFYFLIFFFEIFWNLFSFILRFFFPYIFLFCFCSSFITCMDSYDAIYKHVGKEYWKIQEQKFWIVKFLGRTKRGCNKNCYNFM